MSTNTQHRAGVELLEGRAKVVGKNEVKLDGSDKRTLRVKNIVIATGGQATCIGIPGAELAIISDEVRGHRMGADCLFGCCSSSVVCDIRTRLKQVQRPVGSRACQ